MQSSANIVASIFVALLAPLGPASAYASETDEEVIVTERSDDLIGTATNASVGVVGAKQLEARPLLRPGEVLETVPGLMVTQHSGSGKANQYFLRGFNLDHGTDFASWVADMPVNMPTHAHGQGYSDLNFMIPELVQGIAYKKGPYYATEGDFASAGSAHINYFSHLAENLAEATVGEDNYYRVVLAGSRRVGAGEILAGLEGAYNDGPWVVPENYGKFNGVLRYSQGNHENGFDVTAMAYRGDWNSTDQIPLRAVTSGLVSRLGALDPTDGGESHRYSVSGSWRQTDDNTSTEASAYFIDYQLALFSDFTFKLDNPIQGDQFEQADRRQVYGGQAHHDIVGKFFRWDAEYSAGIQTRFDDIGDVGLFKTAQRRRLTTTRNDAVQEFSVSPYGEMRVKWLEKFQTVAGLRGDFFNFDVTSNDPRNSGEASDGAVSPKLSLIFGPWVDTEYYISLGKGFHSNDARGATIRVDPVDHVTPVARVNPLVETRGFDVGLRTRIVPHLQSTLSFFLLDIDSELLFTGDAGTTEASRPSRRTGVEWTNYYTPWPWMTIDADVSFADARYINRDPAGPNIPGAIETAVAAGITLDDGKRYFGALRLRYFGPRPLIEDDSVRSQATLLLNADAGLRLTPQVKLALGVFNLLDSRDHDIDYFYTSRISQAEPPQGVDDLHFHPVEPRQVRVTLSARF